MAQSAHLRFCRERADQARAEAEAATLAHVRERCLRSCAAWTELADRAARTEALRDEKLAAAESAAAELLKAP